MNSIALQCRYHLAMAIEASARLDDAHRALEPFPKAKTAGWLVGHFAVTVDPARFSVANPYEAARANFPTADDFVRYLMSGHFAYHLGQLTAWCGGAGLSSAAARTV